MRLHVCRSLYCASFYGFSYMYLIALTSVLLFLLLLLCMILFQLSSQVIIILYKLLLTVVVACRAAGSPIFFVHCARASVFPSDLLFVGWLVAYVLYYARASFSFGDLLLLVCLLAEVLLLLLFCIMFVYMYHPKL
jgi:hypothetical protein